jgi:hypothetical protein
MLAFIIEIIRRENPCFVQARQSRPESLWLIRRGIGMTARDTQMDAPAPKKPFAFQPFTPRGVSAFAEASFGRLLLVQALTALIVAIVVIWLVRFAWFPVITEAVHHLPKTGEIRRSELKWNASQPQTLAENYFLAVSVDLDHTGGAISPAHVGVEMERKEIKAYSLLGYVEVPYPAGWRFAFNQPEVEPAWGAWRPALLAGVGALTVAWLFISWTALATVYFLPAWLVGFFTNRRLSVGGSWRMAGASLIPGAFFFTACLIVYGFGGLDLIHLAVAVGLHFLVGWIYLAAALTRLPTDSALPVKANPFAPQQNEPKIESQSLLS